MENLKGKNLLLLEGGILAKDIIDKAHELGIRVVLANWYSVEDAPAKAYADKHIEVNIFDIDAMINIIKEEKIDGIFTAYTDSHLEIYEKLCKTAGFPCFTTADLVPIMVNKNIFKEHCAKAKLPVIDEYDAEKILAGDRAVLDSVEYPIIVKPVDNSGARGISIAHDEAGLISAINRGLEYSASKTVIVEKYLRGQYCLADFLIQDGKAYFCDSCDKPANDDDKDKVNLPGAYVYPSVRNQLIKDTFMPHIQDFIDEIGYKNGVLCFELIYANEKIHIIEAQFRYGAKYQEVYLSNEYGIDEVEILLRHALTGNITEYDLSVMDAPFKRSYALMNILLGKGTIAEIQNPEEVEKFPNVDKYIPMYEVGTEIIPDGSMIQRFGKVSFSADTREELTSAMRYFQSNLKIKDTDGINMVINSCPSDYN